MGSSSELLKSLLILTIMFISSDFASKAKPQNFKMDSHPLKKKEKSGQLTNSKSRCVQNQIKDIYEWMQPVGYQFETAVGGGHGDGYLTLECPVEELMWIYPKPQQFDWVRNKKSLASIIQFSTMSWLLITNS